ncbi:peptide chain release factor N(5)-glutamine methyltransferase [Evansella sp. AB-P1]|uniref:peptide chain release factor N(5)-glutamine methyltransferase n=1 Tax=Evansella sp. AB-P1 TaxID=3037653 RepID=UPI00241F97E3|nr:peptide chain release factor N(5)-glutamine methyltransferase [Evansella sp. AB-P1]MDG5787332.1 peptide chain release factor N(5)-glutamine methyltransferase [Evansella sp. AB-P1]
MNGEMKIYEALKWASSFLHKHHYEKNIGEILLMHHTDWSRSRLLAELQTTLPEEIWHTFKKSVEKAASGVPVQYITGAEFFYGREFVVNPNVLIPRPETEELIEAVLQKLPLVLEKNGGGSSKSVTPISIVDVGTGSGIIAITLKLESTDSQVQAVDISSAALEVAKENAAKLGAAVTFHEGSLLEPLFNRGDKVNVVVSNPPYIPEGDRHLMRENVLDHEPQLALFAGEDGLTIYRELVKQIPKAFTLPGLIAFEIGHGQGQSVSQLIREVYPKADVDVKNDINGKERMVIAFVRK